MIFGALVMAFGIYLLTTLDTHSTQTTVALYLMVTGLGLGPLMPTATLAVQSTVEKSLLGVATSATQFIRSLGSTVGTAVIGSLVASGYADYLKDNAPPQAPGPMISALQDPNALVSEEARDALDRVASAFPGGEQLVNQILQVAREGLSNSIHDGFVFTLVAIAFAIAAALLMKNIRLEGPAVKTPEEGTSDSALAATLAGALEKDARSDEDRDLARFLRSANLSADRTPEEVTALRGIADRIEGGNGDYPALLSAAAGLSNGHEGSERERAVHASRTAIRPLAARNGRNEPASPA
jgi:hypothetical protein